MAILITLPPAEEMSERLKAVNGSSHLQENFYPLFIKHAGGQKSPEDVAEMFQDAIKQYAEDLPALMSFLTHNAEPFIHALVLDAEVAADVHEEFLVQLMHSPMKTS